ncbi:MAG: hypothetical protein ED559_07500 [Phycisphaera sp.]|nr:MAG: hypothetical protein ED559_07500 [Phycisphaera sp.]
MTCTTLQLWIDRLIAASGLTLGKDPQIAIARMLEGPTGNIRLAGLIANALNVGAQAEFEPESLDETLFWASLGRHETPAIPGNSAGVTGEPTGPAIEVWTETELAAVHAAWSLGPDWRAEARRAASWLVANIQPDNATNRPWGVHVFASLALETGDAQFELYAQTLLHNCQVMTGRPDDFSAMILLHAARALQAG